MHRQVSSQVEKGDVNQKNVLNLGQQKFVRK